MSGSVTLAALTAGVERSLRSSGFLPGGSGLLLALSGGADSVCLLLALRSLSQKYAFALEAIHVNHLIRGNQAVRDEDFCRKLCLHKSIRLHIEQINIPQLALERGTGLEETAREERYRAFGRYLDAHPDLSYVVTAHNATDNAETVLFHMARGCGLRGLCGIPECRGRVLRPLLSFSKSEILSVLEQEGQDYVEDATNADTRYTRNFLRHEVLPSMRRLNPNFDTAVSGLCTRLREDSDFVDAEAAAWAEKYELSTRVQIADLVALPAALAKRIITLMYRNAGGSEMPEESHILPVWDLIRTGHTTFIQRFPGNICAYAESGRLIFSSHPSEGVRPEQKIYMGRNVLKGREGVLLLTEKQSELKEYPGACDKVGIKADLSCTSVRGDLYVRERREGDTFEYGGMNHKIKKMLADKRLRNVPRALVPVLCDDRGIVWIPGFAPRDDKVQAEKRELYVYYGYSGGENG